MFVDRVVLFASQRREIASAIGHTTNNNVHKRVRSTAAAMIYHIIEPSRQERRYCQKRCNNISQNPCPFCNHNVIPNWEHCCWHCPAFDHSRPQLPTTAARRLGWPQPHETDLTVWTRTSKKGSSHAVEKRQPCRGRHR